MKETIKRLNKGSLILWGIALVVFVFSYDTPNIQEIVSVFVDSVNFNLIPNFDNAPDDFVN